MTPLGREFYETSALRLAPRLIGQVLVRRFPDGSRASGIIVEVEAYTGVRDRASHAFGGRRTPRNESMYLAPGTAYVYFTYGMHFCFNVVCGRVGEPVAVLIRALEPVEGLAEMTRRRAKPGRPSPRVNDLCSGPGKLCQALGIDRSLDASDLTKPGELWIEPGAPRRAVRAPRVGIASAGAWASKPYRWLTPENPHVSVGVSVGAGSGSRVAGGRGRH